LATIKERAKALIFNAFALSGDVDTLPYTQGDCPGLIDAGPSGRFLSLQSVSFVFKLFHFDTPSWCLCEGLVILFLCFENI
jgi:hypothetical protein